jgi:uncharacterized membrane protein YcgQ (UPF0703/DUF1980 family)
VLLNTFAQKKKKLDECCFACRLDRLYIKIKLLVAFCCVRGHISSSINSYIIINNCSFLFYRSMCVYTCYGLVHVSCIEGRGVGFFSLLFFGSWKWEAAGFLDIFLDRRRTRTRYTFSHDNYACKKITTSRPFFGLGIHTCTMHMTCITGFFIMVCRKICFVHIWPLLVF